MSEKTCPQCHGSGDCPTCEGAGIRGQCECTTCGDLHDVRCRMCDWTGTCVTCDGQGAVDVPAQLQEQPK